MKRLLFVLALVACTDPVEPVLPTLAAGTYQLVSINGSSLPAPQGSCMVNSETITVAVDQTFAEQVVANCGGFGTTGSASGKIVHRADGFRFWANGDSTQVMFSGAALEGATLTATFYGQARTFQRQP